MAGSVLALGITGYSSYVSINGNNAASVTINGSMADVSNSENAVTLTIGDVNCDVSGFVYSEYGFDSDGAYSYQGGKIIITFSIGTSAAIFSDIGYSSGKTMNISVNLTSSTTTPSLVNTSYITKTYATSDSSMPTSTTATGATSNPFNMRYTGNATTSKVYCYLVLTYNFNSSTNWTTAYNELVAANNVATFNLGISLGVAS